MRVFQRIALVAVLLMGAAFPLAAEHNQADCPLTLVGVNPPATPFSLSPHGIFRAGSFVYVLRGQTLTTYNVNEIGELQPVREDFIGSMAARETDGGTAYAGGFLYVSSEAGLEIFDLRGVRPGGSAPILVSRTSGMHYRRLAINGNLLAGLYPAEDLPCYPTGNSRCINSVDLIDVSTRTAPTRITSIAATGPFRLGWDDVAFNYGHLVLTGPVQTFVFNVANPGAPSFITSHPFPGTFLASNGSNALAIGNSRRIVIAAVNPNGTYSAIVQYTIPEYLTIQRENQLVFHPQAWIDDMSGRLITMIDELDPMTLEPARTIAFDVFDFNVPMWEGSAERVYEDVSFTQTDEVKFNPTAIGPYIYVVGEMSGVQSYGVCGQMTGELEVRSIRELTCGGTEIHGWVTGTQKIVNVELFLDNGALGAATLGGPPRIDIPARTPVSTWRINVNLDATPRGEHFLRAVGTDALGNRHQFASLRVFFPGPGQNCTVRRRSGGR